MVQRYAKQYYYFCINYYLYTAISQVSSTKIKVDLSWLVTKFGRVTRVHSFRTLSLTLVVTHPGSFSRAIASVIYEIIWAVRRYDFSIIIKWKGSLHLHCLF